MTLETYHRPDVPLLSHSLHAPHVAQPALLIFELTMPHLMWPRCLDSAEIAWGIGTFGKSRIYATEVVCNFISTLLYAFEFGRARAGGEEVKPWNYTKGNSSYGYRVLGKFTRFVQVLQPFPLSWTLDTRIIIWRVLLDVGAPSKEPS